MNAGGHSLAHAVAILHVKSHVNFQQGAAAFKQTLPNKAMLEGGGTV